MSLRQVGNYGRISGVKNVVKVNKGGGAKLMGCVL